MAMIVISDAHLLALATTARADGRLREARDLLLKVRNRTPGFLEGVTLELAKFEVAAGRYGSAQRLFAEVTTQHPNAFFRSIAQERAHLVGRITSRTEVPVPALRKRLAEIHVDAPERLPSTSLLPEIDFVGSPAAYRSGYDRRRSDPLSTLIRMVKKGVNESTISTLGDFLAAYLFFETDVLASVDYLVPVPTRPERASERGYSIPLLLAEVISRRCAIPLHDEFIRTDGPNFELRTVPRWARSTLTDSAYQLGKRPEWIPDTAALIVDDVITTGSTVRSVARLLRGAGAGRVFAVALAHSEWSGYNWGQLASPEEIGIQETPPCMDATDA